MALPISTKSLSINIISLEGNVANITVKPDFTIEKTKTIVIKHFYGHDKTKLPSQFHLIHSTKFKQLTDDNNIHDEQINEHDILMLVEIRPVLVKENLTEEDLKGPNEEVILQETSSLPIINPPRPISSIKCPANVQNEIEQILISLVKASAKILMYSPEAQKSYEMLKEKLKTRCKPTIDPNAVKTLMEMGYSHKKVLKALHLKKSNVTEALEWLIDHQNDLEDDGNNEDDSDLDLLTFETGNDKYVADPSSSIGTRKKSFKDTCTELLEENQSLKKDGNLVSIVDLLLESFHHYKKMDFKPNPKAIQLLLEMGFDEKNIIDALKVTGNDQTNACEWLLGERRRSLQDLGEGLNPDNAVYKAIMNSPHIQLSLTNPKMLLVYLSMLESPTSINVWMSDPEISLALNQIFRIYHVEKHAIYINQYAGN
ncbi:Ubiquitin-associated domain-containing protein 1 [Dufourea novaeangliae]|uniref:Ubiquitin-associated domain-containing protein 1 n=2 Tax=Dufourea novaeangliae TaxID=178035 RepID=A0A154PIC7_DUFNO|nr:Ubiquitin-associated domain-containing protein 1 [Dufourea novaeangliae]